MRISSQKFMKWMLRNNWEEDVNSCFERDDDNWVTFKEWCEELDLLEDE